MHLDGREYVCRGLVLQEGDGACDDDDGVQHHAQVQIHLLRRVHAARGRRSVRARRCVWADNEAPRGAPVGKVAQAAGQDQQQHELVGELRARDAAQGERAGSASPRRPERNLSRRFGGGKRAFSRNCSHSGRCLGGVSTFLPYTARRASASAAVRPALFWGASTSSRVLCFSASSASDSRCCAAGRTQLRRHAARANTRASAPRSAVPAANTPARR